MKYLRLLFFPFSIAYGIITSFRNWLYNNRIKRSMVFSLPIINIGNLSMGGTGKSPHSEYLIRLLKNKFKLATLSRGYGRRVFGFQFANDESTALTIGDEPMQFHNKFGNEITVAVDADRVNGVSEICYHNEDINLIILDDAFQHRAIKPGFNILLTDNSQPFYNDFILPVGNLREFRSGSKRADCVIVTKCIDLSEIEKEKIKGKINKYTESAVFFSNIKYGSITPFYKADNLVKKGDKVILVTGIANPKPLLDHLSKSLDIVKHFNYRDHYIFKEKDLDEIHNLLIKFANSEVKIITTEKDAMRLLNGQFDSKLKDKPWFYQEIEIEIDQNEKFNELIFDYVQKNSRSY